MPDVEPSPKQTKAEFSSVVRLYGTAYRSGLQSDKVGSLEKGERVLASTGAEVLGDQLDAFISHWSKPRPKGMSRFIARVSQLTSHGPVAD